MAPTKAKHVAEFGDFQTPDDLARQVMQIVKMRGIDAATIIEPSCGRGAFLVAAREAYLNTPLFGLDVNAGYLGAARERLASDENLVLAAESFFRHDWSGHISRTNAPLLIVGNPPWVTNSELGSLGSDNLPSKSNFQNMKGFDAVTGKANFDISEWMLLQNIEWLRQKGGSLAVLCKTAVARKILAAMWKRGQPIAEAAIYKIDAAYHFSAAVDACLFLLRVDGTHSSQSCSIYESLSAQVPTSTFGYVDEILASDIGTYRRFSDLRGVNKAYTWRSGIKHDASKVMELDRTADGFINGLGELVSLEETYVFPLIKSSDIAGVRQREREKVAIVTQRTIGEETAVVERVAPHTWAYLNRHKAVLDGRTSVIYRNKPAFSIFGVGDYTFAPWKIAISGLYKRLTFRLFGSDAGKPMVFDDTVYFLPFESFSEAQSVLEMLCDPAQKFLESMTFWDDKRPITVELLKRLDIARLARALNRDQELSLTRDYTSKRGKSADGQGSLTFTLP